MAFGMTRGGDVLEESMGVNQPFQMLINAGARTRSVEVSADDEREVVEEMRSMRSSNSLMKDALMGPGGRYIDETMKEVLRLLNLRWRPSNSA